MGTWKRLAPGSNRFEALRHAKSFLAMLKRWREMPANRFDDHPPRIYFFTLVALVLIGSLISVYLFPKISRGLSNPDDEPCFVAPKSDLVADGRRPSGTEPVGVVVGSVSEVMSIQE